MKKLKNETLNDISKYLNIDIEKAKLIKEIIKCDTDFILNNSKSAKEYYDNCLYKPENYLIALYAINEIIGFYGVEYIAHKNDTYTANYGIEYCNSGDTYNTTILYDHNKNDFYMSDYGSIVEKKMNDYL